MVKHNPFPLFPFIFAPIKVNIGEERRCDLRGPYTEILLPPEQT
jgi:hypothetical protein